MFTSLRRRLRSAAACLSLLISVFALAGQSSPVQSKQQYQTAVQQAVNGPFRVDVQPVQQGVKQGSSAILKIQIHNANNELVNASDKMRFVVRAWSAGGKEQTHSLEIAPGSNSGQITVKADEAGQRQQLSAGFSASTGHERDSETSAPRGKVKADWHCVHVCSASDYGFLKFA